MANKIIGRHPNKLLRWKTNNKTLMSKYSLTFKNSIDIESLIQSLHVFSRIPFKLHTRIVKFSAGYSHVWYKFNANKNWSRLSVPGSGCWSRLLFLPSKPKVQMFVPAHFVPIMFGNQLFLMFSSIKVMLSLIVNRKYVL